MATAEYLEPLLAPLLQRHAAGFDRVLSMRRLTGGANSEIYAVLTAGAEGARTRYCLRCRSPPPPGSPDNPQQITLALEAQLLRLIRKSDSGVPVPRVVGELPPNRERVQGFLMSWEEGETLGGRIAHDAKFAALRSSDGDRLGRDPAAGRPACLAHQCGFVLGRLHTLPVPPLLQRELRTSTALADARYWRSSLRTALASQAGERPQRRPALEYAFRWLLQNAPPAGPGGSHPGPSVLVHGDFRNGNLVVRPSSGLHSVLDWERAHLGDGHADLAWLCVRSWRFGAPAERSVGGFGGLERLCEGYAVGSGGALRVDKRRLHWWMAMGSAQWAVICVLMAALWESQPAARRGQELERAIIGRRASEAELDLMTMLTPRPRLRLAPRLAPPSPPPPALAAPSVAGLLSAVTHFLRGDVGPALLELPNGAGRRLAYLSRVAANGLDIVAREHAGLEQTLHTGGGDDGDDNSALVMKGREEDTEARQLLAQAAQQVAIDQPRYATLASLLREEAEAAQQSPLASKL